jgi:hypothetical protein
MAGQLTAENIYFLDFLPPANDAKREAITDLIGTYIYTWAFKIS